MKMPGLINQNALFLGLILSCFSFSVQAQTVSLTDAVLNDDGSYMLMSQIVAEEYCAMQGTRLPTVRELAIYAQSLGASGLKETSFAQKPVTDTQVQQEITQMKTQGYTAITVISENQEFVDFYYNPSGYKAPTGALAYNNIWSSTDSPAAYEAYDLVMANGSIASYDTTHDPQVVRCISTPAAP